MRKLSEGERRGEEERERHEGGGYRGGWGKGRGIEEKWNEVTVGAGKGEMMK